MKIGEKNVGMIDRAIRIVFGIILLYLFAGNMVAALWSYLVALIGIILLVTGAVGTCPLYSMLGMSTLPKKA
jgi:Inner membrane protein YgaP-like, transmembrane domain